MKINHNIAALNAYNQLSRNQTSIQTSLERLSSGKRINRAADDAAGMAISQKMDTQVRGLSVASRNASDGISVIQTGEGALNEVHSMLQRMRELAVQSSSGTYTDDDRNAIKQETDNLISEITRIGNSTEFNTIKLLNGDLSGLPLVSGNPDPAKTMILQIGANQGQTLSINIPDLRSSALGIGTLNVATQTDAEAAIDTLDSAIATVSSSRATLGALQNRLEHTTTNLDTANENLTAAMSRIEDADMAQEMAEYTKTNILIQAGTSMLAQANQLPQGVLQLLNSR